MKVRQIINSYTEAFDQIINVDKSLVFFGKNMREDGKIEMLEILWGMKQAEQIFRITNGY